VDVCIYKLLMNQCCILHELSDIRMEGVYLSFFLSSCGSIYSVITALRDERRVCKDSGMLLAQEWHSLYKRPVPARLPCTWHCASPQWISGCLHCILLDYRSGYPEF